MDSNERKIVQELVTVLGCVIPASDGYEPRTNLWNKYTAAKNMLATAPQVVADERAAFEVHITDNGTWPRAAERSVDGEYRLMATAVAWNTWRAATDSFASRTAAPVQAQEPVAGKPCPYCGSTDGAHDKAYPHPRAPVQPVAVPDGLNDKVRTFIDSVIEIGFEGCDVDGAAIQEWAEKAGLLEERTMTEPCSEGQNCRCAEDGDFPLTCYQKTYRSAAPAAQGDAKDTERLRWLAETGARISWSMDGEYCAVWLHDERDGTESRPAEGYPLKCYDSWHRAIDAAIAAKAAS